MKRALDIFASSIGLILFSPLLVAIAILVRLTSTGPALHWSNRVGRHNNLFAMPKFRTMYQGTPQLATHLLSGADRHITPVGRFLRKTSLDELPQLWSVFIGQMSLVGPRPALYNQYDLVELRTACSVHVLSPGVTGWAQINGRDELSSAEKVKFDLHYLQHQRLWLDLRILALTVVKVFRREGIQQASPQTTAAESPERISRHAA